MFDRLGGCVPCRLTTACSVFPLCFSAHQTQAPWCQVSADSVRHWRRYCCRRDNSGSGGRTRLRRADTMETYNTKRRVSFRSQTKEEAVLPPILRPNRTNREDRLRSPPKPGSWGEDRCTLYCSPLPLWHIASFTCHQLPIRPSISSILSRLGPCCQMGTQTVRTCLLLPV